MLCSLSHRVPNTSNNLIGEKRHIFSLAFDPQVFSVWFNLTILNLSTLKKMFSIYFHRAKRKPNTFKICLSHKPNHSIPATDMWQLHHLSRIISPSIRLLRSSNPFHISKLKIVNFSFRKKSAVLITHDSFFCFIGLLYSSINLVIGELGWGSICTSSSRLF